ncbi:DNA cross-link repair 1A protein [Nosema bombycis CQ1]|uniref:DNA cross-link repair 1A protein n=1 Tax=Nosema bombycis (strain CQ1 / CVCC 102059) TaxID=578461 RepID=R0MQX2_NOSB1|nr:DNA cross-link repair 1A protein [Nosema bombycis CQ1]|eukprot:EOB15283.1 DNA cross-link repair 1A protein [Nosema bombycis CQ1]
MHISDLPPYKRILNTSYTVDFFKSPVEGVSHYFLSHFHADHYTGLTKSFPFEIYCSQTTANLLSLKFKVKTKPLEMFKIYKLNNNDTVMCIDANHCPGAVCFIFNIKNNIHNNYLLHTGDFRFTKLFMHQIFKLKFSTVFLDNTYEGFRPFPSQLHSIKRVINVINNLISKPCLFPIKYVFIFCTYSVGKEKVFLCAGEFFNKSLRVTKEKMKIYECFDEYTKNKMNEEVKEMVRGIEIERKEVRSYFKKGVSVKSSNGVVEEGLSENKGISMGKVISESKDLEEGYPYPTPYPTPIKPYPTFNYPTPLSRITTQELPDQFLIMSTTQIEKNKLNKFLKGIQGSKAIVFCGTGWKDSIKYFDWVKEDGRVIKKGIEIHYIPYSEHSSSDELKEFKREVDYERIVNTVKNKDMGYDREV